MKMKSLFLIAVTLLLTTNGFAQFAARLQTQTPLTNSCSPNGTPLSETCTATIYWDQNDNGPDPSDLPPVVGSAPGQVNFNTFTLNGWEWGFPAGTFATILPRFGMNGFTPSPSRYYIVVECEGATHTSSVFTIMNGNNTYTINDWSCVTTADTCERYLANIAWQLQSAEDHHNHEIYSACLWMCANVPVIVPGLLNDELYDVPWGFATISAGCGENTPCNDDDAQPAALPMWNNGSTTINLLYTYGSDPIVATAVSPVDGWACLYVDVFWPVSQGAFDAVAGDGIVSLAWNTLAETSVDHFNVLRKENGANEFTTIASVQAENDPSGATYTYVDRAVTNETAYTYSLETVNLDGSTQSWGVEVNATPQAGVVNSYALQQNFPNPFNPVTTIAFDAARSGDATLNVYDVNGRLVEQLLNGFVESGRHDLQFDASKLANGLYFYTLRFGNEFTDTKKMLLLK